MNRFAMNGQVTISRNTTRRTVKTIHANPRSVIHATSAGPFRPFISCFPREAGFVIRVCNRKGKPYKVPVRIQWMVT